MRYLFASICGLVLFSVLAFTVEARHAKQLPTVTVPCGAITVPFSIYRLPITSNSAFTMTFQSSGPPESLVTFTAQNFQPNGFYWTRTAGNCGTCTLVLPSVPASREGVQLAVDVYGGDCPGAGVTITNFSLQVGPAH